MKQPSFEPVEVEVLRGRTLRSGPVDRVREERMGGRDAAVARLVELAEDAAELSHAPDGRGWARIDPDAHRLFPWLRPGSATEARCEPDPFPRDMATRGVDFPRWLARLFHDGAGFLPTRGALDAAVDRLDAIARLERPERGPEAP